MVEIVNIRKSFQQRILFEDYSLSVPDGAFAVIHGKSGAGKTTLLNIIGGLEKVDAGQVLVNGIDISKAGNKKQYYRHTVGFLFQNFALVDSKTVRQNLEMVSPAFRTGISIEDALKKVGLSGYDTKRVYTLSGGEQQRVALARLMIKKCDLILADEPTGSLDPENTGMVMDFLRDINKEGKTIIIVTHNEEIVKNAEYKIEL